MGAPLIELDEVTVQYQTAEGPITAVSDASLEVQQGEMMGIVGESGSGKSTLAKAILSVLDSNGEVVSGRILYQGEDISEYTERELNRNIRWTEVSYVPQSSMDSLNPLQRIDKQAIEIGKTHTDLSKDEILQRFEEAFAVVGLPEERIHDYPHEFSGGMQQRAILALAVFLEPSLIIADEPTTALDVIMQDQIFKHLLDLVNETGTSVLLITHDISLVFESSDRVAVMHAGQVCESGTVRDIYNHPSHPYSILLQDAFPDISDPDRELNIIEGHPPTVQGEINECLFADRCPWAVDECRSRRPPLEPVSSSAQSGEHRAACFRKDETLEGTEQ